MSPHGPPPTMQQRVDNVGGAIRVSPKLPYTPIIRSLAMYPVNSSAPKAMMTGGGADLDGAQRERPVARTCPGDAAGPGLGADRNAGDGGDRNRSAEPHDEGRDDAGPEQPLRQERIPAR